MSAHRPREYILSFIGDEKDRCPNLDQDGFQALHSALEWDGPGRCGWLYNNAEANAEVAHGVVLYPQLNCLGGSIEGGSNNM